MSESRKRSRKSKLELRQAFDTDESQEDYENTILQIQKLPRLLGPSPLSTDHTYSIPSVTAVQSEMQISVKVEVEEFDETVLIQDPPTNIGINHTAEWIPPKTHVPSIEVNIDQAFKISEHIMWSSTNPADHFLGIELRNCWGNIFKMEEKSCPYNELIQKALQDWALSISPLRLQTYLVKMFYYQCRICQKAWWQLSSFREHIQTHSLNALSVIYQNQMNNASLIATADGNEAAFNYVSPEESCPRCGQDCKSDIHILQTTCAACKELMPACTHKYHFKVCEKIPANKLIERYRCRICKVLCDTIPALVKHLELTHTVRSDDPLPYDLSDCPFCQRSNQTHSNFRKHCGKSSDNRLITCRYCFRKFFPKTLSRMHFMLAKKNYSCRICNEKIKVQCQEVDHMVTHSDKYGIAYRCMYQGCPPNLVFANERAVQIHGRFDHGTRFGRQKLYGKVLMPAQCLQFCSQETWQRQRGIISLADTNSKSVEQIVPEINKSKALIEKDKCNKQDTIEKDMQKNDDRSINNLKSSSYEAILSSLIFQGDKTKSNDLEIKSAQEKKSSKQKKSTKTKKCSKPQKTEDSNALKEQNTDEQICVEEQKPTKEQLLSAEQQYLEQLTSLEELATSVGIIIKDEPEDYNEYDMHDIDIEECNIPNMDKEDVPASQIGNIQGGQTDNTQIFTQYNNTVEVTIENTSKEDKQEADTKEDEEESDTLDDEDSHDLTIDVEIPRKDAEEEERIKDNMEIERAQIDLEGQPRSYNIEIKMQPMDDEEGDISQGYNIVVHMPEFGNHDKPQADGMEVEMSQIEGVTIKTEPYQIKNEPDEIKEQLEDNLFEGVRIEDILKNVKVELNEPQNLIEATHMQICGDDSDDEVRLEIVEETGETENVGAKKRKKGLRYTCPKCGYTAHHGLYRFHRLYLCKDPLPSKPNKKYNKKSKEDRKNGKKSQKIPNSEADLKLTCTKCDATYKTWYSYLKHFTKHGYRLMTCPACNTNVENIATLINHVRKHIKQNYIGLYTIGKDLEQSRRKQACKTCRAEITMQSTFAHWESHLELINGNITNRQDLTKNTDNSPHTVNSKILQCEVLTKLLNELTYVPDKNIPKILKQYRASVCFICNHRAHRKNDYKRHLIEHLTLDALSKRSENVDFSLKCQLCGECFHKEDQYKYHMREHGALTIYKCELCDKTFSDSSNFAKHKKIHNIQAFVCDICNKKFHMKTTLEKHIIMHLTTKPIKCRQCKKTFHTQSSYRKHDKVTHNKMSQTFRCRLCGLTFSSCKQRWDHSWEVHKERRYIADCPVCHKEFRKFADVRSHGRLVHGLNLKMSHETNDARGIKASRKINTYITVEAGV